MSKCKQLQYTAVKEILISTQHPAAMARKSKKQFQILVLTRTVSFMYGLRLAQIICQSAVQLLSCI